MLVLDTAERFRQILANNPALKSPNMNQQCKVCNEPAAGFHFGAFTCEGCKSFFGRTYNNLGSISECKNNGECVINKKNRTSCKACRLRKCLLVGMSKSGSRYGRRSNWFKIHCLLQEQQQQSGGNLLSYPLLPPGLKKEDKEDSAASSYEDDDSNKYKTPSPASDKERKSLPPSPSFFPSPLFTPYVRPPPPPPAMRPVVTPAASPTYLDGWSRHFLMPSPVPGGVPQEQPIDLSVKSNPSEQTEACGGKAPLDLTKRHQVPLFS